jgi:hypothetical protein
MEPWRQGYLLQTKRSEGMSIAEKMFFRREEALCIYENFSAVDEGKSRKLIAKCETPEIAAHIVKLHNDAVEKERFNNASGSPKAP